MSLLSNLSVRTKLLLSFVIVSVIAAGVGIVGIMQLSTINTMLSHMYDDEVRGCVFSLDTAWNIAAMGRDARQAILETNDEEIKKLKVEVEACHKDTQEALSNIGTCFDTSEGQALVAKVKEAYPPYYNKIVETLDLSIQGKDEEAKKAVEESHVMGKQLSVYVNDMADLKQANALETDGEGDALYANSRFMMLSAVVGGVLLALAMGYFIARAITTPLAKAVEVLQAVAGGDLTAHLDVHTKDEVGQMATSLNAAVSAMREALTEVRSVADSVASASHQLAASSQQISTGAQQQASSLEETASSLEEITVTITQNADNADQANQLSARSREVAEKGGKVVGDAVISMQEINASSKKIADIITAIDEIAFQTNLLALNAAVEAARAGEQGRGFAVVAGEVRNLAQRSAGAAKEIKSLIQDSVRKVEIGSQLVNQSGQTLEEIVAAVKRVTDIVAEISAASREQATGIEQVNRAVSQMDHVTQENASQTEELSGTAEGLSGQAEGLQQLVARFTLQHNSGKSMVTPSRSTPNPTARRPVVTTTTTTTRSLTKSSKRATPALPTVKQFPAPAKTTTHDLDKELVGAAAAPAKEVESFEEF